MRKVVERGLEDIIDSTDVNMPRPHMTTRRRLSTAHLESYRPEERCQCNGIGGVNLELAQAFFSDGVIPKDFISDEEEKENPESRQRTQIRASNSSKIMEVASQVALRVDDASVGDLLIPFVSSTSEQWNLSKDWYLPFIHKQMNRLVCVCDCGLTEEVTPYQYDVDIVMIMLEEFLLQGKSPGSDNPPRRSKGDFAFTTTVPKENSK
nr:BTB/POZ domain-containing protein At1g67900-like [Ipomoea batatas]